MSAQRALTLFRLAAAMFLSGLGGGATAQSTATTKAEALIAEVSNGANFFRALPDGDVMHIQSGMVCVPGAKQMRLAGLTVSPVGKPGDDVGCDYITPTGKMTVFATRANGQSVRQVGATIVRGLRVIFPDAKPTSGPMVSFYPGLADPLAASFLVTWNGLPGVTSVWVSQQGDWIVEVRATYSDQVRHDAELIASLASVQAANTIRAKSH